jgi:hypothetical protein
VKAYKAFNHDWTCRGFQYEIGKTYQHAGKISLCNSGFHACEAPLDVFSYYPPTANFAEVELDEVSPETLGDSKRTGAAITIKTALTLAGIISAQVEYVKQHADGKNLASGNYSTAASSGHGSKAASSGNGSTAASSGDGSTAASSGNYSKAASSGEQTIAMVAGLRGRAKAGQLGAFALPWLDGKQVRIAIGIIGEAGIKADTWYQVGEAGKLVEAKE